jgi:hypothetical protein
VRRPDDLLVCTVSFRGFALLQDPPRLDRAADDAFIIFDFPPQSFGEEAFLLAEGQPQGEAGQNLEVSTDLAYPPRNVPRPDSPVPDGLPAARIRMSGSSRVVVAMPAPQNSLAFDLQSVLAALRDWPMRLAPGAVPDPSPVLPGVDWLNALVDQASWTGLHTDMTRFLGQLAGSAPETRNRVQDALGALANQLAQQAAVGLAQPDTDAAALRGSLQQALVEAGATLRQRYPALDTGAGRSASLAALSVGAAQALTGAPGAVLGSAAQLQNLPFVSLMLGPQEPAENVTALELPYRLITSPLKSAAWRHNLSPVTRGGRTELWHTRLSGQGDVAGADPPSRIRAIWSPDYRPQARLDELYHLIGVPGPPGQPPVPNPALIRMSLDPVDRSMLVTLMAGFDAKQNDGSAFTPVSSEAKRLHLSALGALLDVEGNWSTLPDGIDLEQWRHEAALGRDHYVRMVYRGWLCPFGHAASLVKVTERRFQSLAPGLSQRVAVLRQRFYVVVRQRVRTYSGANHPHRGRDFPFTSVELLTRVTPDLTEPGVGASRLPPAPSGGDPYVGLPGRTLFWPMTASASPQGMADVLFEIAATDLAGNRVTFAMPLLFVGKPANDRGKVQMATIRAAYNAAQKREAQVGGAIIAYAPADPAAKGDPKLPTSSVTFRAGEVEKAAEPNFYPEVDAAAVGVKPVQKLLGKPDFVTEVAYPDVYARHGFDAGANAGQVFLQFTSALPLNFGAKPSDAKNDALGALASPQMNLLGLSRITGPVAGQLATDKAGVGTALNKVVGGQFDPGDFFGDATLLGGIKLSEIVQASLSLAGAEVPKLVSRDFPDRVEASFDWDTQVQASDTRKLIIPNADPGEPGTRLIMSGVVRTPLDPAQPASFQASAVMNNFKVNLFGFVILWFEELSFKTKSGQKPDVSVQMRPGDDAVAFGGPLEFVNALRRYIPSNGFSDPPALLVTPSGISASYSLNLPAVEVGVFALSNVAIGASFSLPFDGAPAVVRFAFSAREHPFSLTVSLLGGGGFFAIAVSSHGVNEIEAALEFGAVVAINLGVASGSVEVKAGVYFHWRELPSDKGSVELAGYVRIHGELCVLAIISVALTFNLQLGYQKEGDRSIVYGEASLTVEIDILMFSTSVSVRCRREFSGGGADPKFIEQIPTPEIWTEYCEAFALEAA